VKLTNVSNPAAFGVEWAGESGATYQLVNPRSTASLWFGARRAGAENWAQTTVTSPERFGMVTAPSTFRDFLKIAEAFVSGEE
jgi:hypothetical protein